MADAHAWRLVRPFWWVVLTAVAAACPADSPVARPAVPTAGEAVPATGAAVPVADSLGVDSSPWREIERGLDYGEWPAPPDSPAGDRTVRVLRVDPARFELKLLMASAPEQGSALTPAQWCRRNRLVAAVNAGMYAEDYLTAISLLRSRHHVNNARVTRHMAVLVFDRLDDGVPPMQIVDREQQDFAALATRYGSQVQGIRMVALDGRNVWTAQPRRWSAAAAGMDTTGRLLLLHVQSPYPMHDLIELLRAMPLGLRNLMYLEGGPPAQLCIRDQGEEIELTGCYDPDGPAAGREAGPSPVPNVIGVSRLVPWAPTDALHGDGPTIRGRP